MKIAVEGCCHGALDAIYKQIGVLEEQNGYKVPLLLICGDFQAIRNERDLQCMSVPDKYRQLGEFHKYYTGEKVAPILTIVIGGNHEASNYFWELYHGGWLAHNIYFLGHAGCVQVNGIRIAGASGIFKANDFSQGHWERLPYNPGAMRSIYHIREYNIRRLSLLSHPDIFLSHDWPQSIEHYGNLSALLKRKPFFRQDIQTGNLGSPPMMGLLRTLKPEWWFSAHLHVRYEANVVHGDQLEASTNSTEHQVTPVANPDEIAIDDIDDLENDQAPNSSTHDIQSTSRNPDEIALDDEEEIVAALPLVPDPPLKTRFLALDKCLPHRQFLEVVDIQEPSEYVKSEQPVVSLSYDPEWLAITRAFNPYMSNSRAQQRYPEEAEARGCIAQELDWVRNTMQEKGLNILEDCQSFVKTAPAPNEEGSAGKRQRKYPCAHHIPKADSHTVIAQHYANPQTAAFCSMLEIENKVDMGR